MHVQRLPTEQDVSREVVKEIGQVLAQKPDAVLVLPTGQTPMRIYHDLTDECRNGNIDMSRAHIFQLDELLGVAPDDQRSYFAFLRRTLVDQIVRDDSRIHLLDGSTGNPEAEITQHASKLRELGGADYTLLGLGRNGHVGLNEPPSDMTATSTVRQIHMTTRRLLESVFTNGTEPTHALTLGMDDIAASGKIRMVVLGNSKAVILKTVMTENPSPQRPASLLLSLDQMHITADEAAAALLPEELGQAAT